MADTRDDLWLSIIAESDEPDDTAPLDVATAKNLIRAHNQDEEAHADIRAQLQEIANVQTVEIKEYATKRNFPASGDTSVTIYVDVSTGNLYRYNTNNRQYEALAMDAIPNSVALEGRPTAPTASTGTNTTQIATTAFVQNELAALREQSESVTPVYYDSRTKAKLSLLGENGTIVTNVTNGAVEHGSSDAITGDQLWKAQQDMANMSALAARNIAANAAEIELLKQARNPLENLTDENKETITGLINVVGDTGIDVTGSVTDDGVKVFTVKAVPEGDITEGNTEAVTGGKIYTAIEAAKAAFSEEIADKISREDLDTITSGSQIRLINGDHTAAMRGETDGQVTYAINVRANGSIQRNDGRIITGGAVYTETRQEVDGHITRHNNTAAQNIQSLDNALHALSASIGTIPDLTHITEDIASIQETLAETSTAANASANKDLSNLTDAGKDVISALAAGNFVKIINGDHTTATIGEENGQTTYAINVRATGAIANRDGRIVTGQTVYNEVRPASGTYISPDYTTGTNLKNLDTQLKANTDSLADKADASTVTSLAETVNGYDALLSRIDENVTETLTTSVQRIDGLAAQVEALSESIPELGYHAGQYIQISDDDIISVVVNGVVQEGNIGLVTGDKVARAIAATTVDTGQLIRQVHDELTHRIENLEDEDEMQSYSLIKNNDTDQLILLKGDSVVSRVSVADHDTKYSLSLDNKQLVFAADDGSNPTIIDLLSEVKALNVYDSIAEFPAEGEEGTLYIDAETNVPYRWDPDEEYVEVSGNKHIDSLTDEDIDSLF